MKIAIVGAGIAGVTTAWELAADGHEVTVFERHGAVAEEASFANAGLLSQAALMPWPAPGMTPQALRRLSGLKAGWPLPWRELGWWLAWRRAQQPAALQARRAVLQPLAGLSRDRLGELCGRLRLRVEGSSGVLALFRSSKEFALAQAALPALHDAGLHAQALTPEAARQVEPGLCAMTELAGAVHLPDDGVVNCRQFALMLKKEAEALGVRFEFDSNVAPLDKAQPATLQVSIAGAASQAMAFDAVVLCAGMGSAALLRRTGLRLPLEAVHGYSISAAMGEPLNAPRSAVLDLRHHASISRLGQRVRVAGHAALGQRGARRDARAIQDLYRVLQDWFPAAAQLGGPGAAVQEWQGARPSLPDGLPVLGASGLPGLWLNLGHGNEGWSLACGSARVLADQVAGRDTALDAAALGIARLGG